MTGTLSEGRTLCRAATREIRAKKPAKRNAGLGLAALIILGVLAIYAPSASAAVKPFEVKAYGRTLGVPRTVARDDLKIQAKGGEADIAGGLEDRLHGDFAGVWFDPASGEYVVSMTSHTVDAPLGKEMAVARLASSDYRTRLAKYSWKELEAAQGQIDGRLRAFFDVDLVYTSIDPRTNAVVVHVASTASKKDHASLSRIAKGFGGKVELRSNNDDQFHGVRDACSSIVPNCGNPLRGGVEIGPWKQANGGICTAAFRAIGNTNGKRYLLSAGHCAAENNPSNPIMNWQARDEQKLPVYGQAKYLGEVEQLAFPAHDWMKINVTGSEWDIPLSQWPSMVAYWSKGSGVAGQPPISAEYPIYGEASSVVGQGVCHSGIASGGSCGQVTETNVSYNFGEPGNTTHNLVKVKGACSEAGDSGGPWFASNIAYGIHIGKAGALESCGSSTFYEEITVATQALGVTVGTPPPPPSNPSIAFQSNAGQLITMSGAGGLNTEQGMMAGTSPSIDALESGGYEMAFQANNSTLIRFGAAGNEGTGQGMMGGTSPGIAGLTGGGYEMAFQANNGLLYRWGTAGNEATALGMMGGTSPSIAGLTGGGYQIAFQANSSALWTWGSAGSANTGLGMAAGTSPSIAGLTGGGYQIAFQANSSALWTWGSAGSANTGLGMAAGTSPSITGLTNGGYEIAFQSNAGTLWTFGTAGSQNWGQGMKAGTSPSITALPNGGYEMAFQANTGQLVSIGTAGGTNWGQGMKAGTSPSIAFR